MFNKTFEKHSFCFASELLAFIYALLCLVSFVSSAKAATITIPIEAND